MDRDIKTAYTSTASVDTKDPAFDHSREKTAHISTKSIENVEPGFEDPQWKTGFLARFPWMGLGALFTVLICTASAVVVLLVSDGKSQDHWDAQIAPNVIISGLNNLSNICFSVAIGNGVAIAWWRKTLKGATIEDLHRSWKFSSSIKQVVFGARYFNFIALAALTAKLTVIDSMLLQKATSTSNQSDLGFNRTMKGYTNITLPYTAQIGDRSGDISFLDDWFRQHLNKWSQAGGAFPDPIYDCKGKCLADVPGVGFEIDCTSNETAMDYGRAAYEDAVTLSSLSENETSTFNGTFAYSLFSVDFSAIYGASGVDDDYSKILMTVLTTTAANNTNGDENEPSCPGTVTRHTCYLRPAVIAYPVTFSDEIAPPNQQQTDPDVIAIINTSMYLGHNVTLNDRSTTNYSAEAKQQEGFSVVRYDDVLEEHLTLADPTVTRIGGIAYALNRYFAGNSSITFEGITQRFNLQQTGLSEMKLVNASSDQGQCGFTYEDPLNYLVQQINSLMFTISLDPFFITHNNSRASDPAFQTKWKATQYSSSIHYVTSTGYMWGAVASTIFCVICVLPSYYGYWQLGRDVTLGPFEIANAFRAPVLDHPRVANAEVKELIKEVGAREVRYGEIISEEAAGRLAIAEPQSVRRVHPSIHDRSG